MTSFMCILKALFGDLLHIRQLEVRRCRKPEFAGTSPLEVCLFDERLGDWSLREIAGRSPLPGMDRAMSRSVYVELTRTATHSLVVFFPLVADLVFGAVVLPDPVPFAACGN